MDKRTIGIIATVGTGILCGCCALFSCFMGITTLTGNNTYTLGDTVGDTPASFGFVFLCLSVILIAVPVVVGIITLRKKPEDEVLEAMATDVDEPLPPAS